MYKVEIRPQWTLQTVDGQILPPRLIDLLLAVHETGSLAAASRSADLSYRYAWGILRQAQTLFGQPLLRSTRGRGARLTALGERLVWADNRIAARLSPMLDSLATELEAELSRVLATEATPLRLHASHGFGVEMLRKTLAAAEQPLDLKYRSPDDALTALRAGACDLAGLHLPIGGLEGELLRHYQDRLDDTNDRVIHLAMRRQGLVVAPGNPKHLRVLSDLLRDDVRFIHRQPGSGTRLLLECMLAREDLPLSAIHGCDVEELTHAAVAAYVASGLADVGLALEPPARRYGLDFIPMITEHYFFLCQESALHTGQLQPILELLRSDGFRHELGQLPGYDPSYCGTVQTLGDAFPSMAATRQEAAATV
jgi:molybdate transport repressor ModE-like protein